MRLRWLSVPAAALSVALTACTNGGYSSAENPTGTGPFDSRGNYVEAWADNPSQWKQANSRPVDAEPDKQPEPVQTPPLIAANTPQKTATTPVINPKPTPKPAPKPKPKPAPVKVKPKVVRHTVKKGDSLYAIAKRYGTTVGKIQSANRLKGTIIRPGQSLVIPR
ncbi:LysM peptidoglycan-binding domain-containing protein [Luteolibacter marinus]|uniref:LysM peptidoglycan-binding domain-containing protein n=1 Tax=Luteolibacter marinus TaxID=2776705 RepID=UPI0018689505|nr:LysM peptidoglycan-binding domain-containing protein [Luteolibacter marinus]